MKDNYAGESRSCTCDDHNRPTEDAVAGGSNPRTCTYGYAVVRLVRLRELDRPSSRNAACTARAIRRYRESGSPAPGPDIRTGQWLQWHALLTDRSGARTLCGMARPEQHNVHLLGPAGAQPMVFAHGFGCDQNMWRFVVDRFKDRYRVVLFDHIGAGGSDPGAYDEQRYGHLEGYAADVVELCDALELQDVIFVGHSVSATIGVLAAAAAPHLFRSLVLVGPSPRYIDDDGYVGGFTRADIEELLASLDSNYLGWSSAMAPVIMGRPDRPEFAEELETSFCRTDPDVARRFAHVTFLSDNRADFARVQLPTLVIQCTDDAIAPRVVGEFVRDRMPNATMVLLDATGHCPHLSAPAETAQAIEEFLGSVPAPPR